MDFNFQLNHNNINLKIINNYQSWREWDRFLPNNGLDGSDAGQNGEGDGGFVANSGPDRK